MVRKLENTVRELQRELAVRRRALGEHLALLDAERVLRHEVERASRLKDEFLALLSHQLRNPLNAIVGWAYLLRDTQLDAESTARGLDTICRNAELQSQLISNVLEATQLIAAPARFDAAPVDLSSLLRTALASVAPAAEAKQLRVEANLDAGTGAVAGDSARLQQVFWSLVSGAVASAARGSTLRVALEPAGADVEVSIRLGNRSDAPADPSGNPQQAENADEAGASSWGLRFAVARYFVELHGGTIETRANGDPRARVTLRLPTAGKPSASHGG